MFRKWTNTPALTLFSFLVCIFTCWNQRLKSLVKFGKWLIQINSRLPNKSCTPPPQNKILLRYVDNSASCLPDMLDMMSFSQCSSRLPFSFHFSLWCSLNILMWAGELLGFQSVLCCQQCSLFFWADTVLPRYVVKSIWKISNAADSRFCPVYCLLYFSLTNIVFVYYIFSTLKHDLSSQATRQSTLSSKHTAVL